MIEDLLGLIERDLADKGAGEANLLGVLDRVIAHFHCVVGTIHVLNPQSGMLKLVAQRGIPEAIMDRVRVIPIGKGMAGLAAERREPVQVCNLQTDESGAAKPGAKLTQMEGSISFPMIVDGDLKGTMGVAKPVAYEFTKEEAELLLRIGSLLGKNIQGA